MGAQIAAHFANAGIPSLLLDIVPPGASNRNQLATESVERLKTLSPNPLFVPELASIITPGNLEDDLPKLAETDWIIEAVVERLDIKKSLFEKIEPHCSPQAIISSNTSGIPIAEIVQGRS